MTFESPKNEKLSLFLHGERAYDHVILFPPKSKGNINATQNSLLHADQDIAYGPALTPQLLLQFTKQEGNVLLTLGTNSQTPAQIGSLLLELDIHLPTDRNSLVVDHFNYDTIAASEEHDILLLPEPSFSRPQTKNFFAGTGIVAFPRSVAQELGNASPLLTKILSAKSTAYSYNPKDDSPTAEEPFAVGEQISLVSAMQARNSARFTVFGSAEALEDKWFDAKVKGRTGKEVRTANQEFARKVISWTFKELGVLKVGRVEHYLSSSNGKVETAGQNITQTGYLNPAIYRIKNDVVGWLIYQLYCKGS